MITNVRAECAHGIALKGQATGNVSDILLRDWQLTITGEGDNAYSRFVDFRDETVTELPEKRMPWYYAEHIERLQVQNITVNQAVCAKEWDITPWIIGGTMQI